MELVGVDDEIGQADLVAGFQKDGPLDDVLQFAHVAGPMMFAETFGGEFGEAFYLAFLLGADFTVSNEVFGQEEDVVAA